MPSEKDRLADLAAAIASDRPAPAGGSASAAAVVISAALLEKAAQLSLRHWEGAAAARDRAHALRLSSEELIEADVHAYLGYVEAVRGAKDMDAASRERAVGPARTRTVDVPLSIVRAAGEAVALAAALIAEGNPNLRSDAAVAGELALGGANGALITMTTNLSGSPRDARLVEARSLVRSASARLRSPAARGSAGDPGRAPARSADSRRR